VEDVKEDQLALYEDTAASVEELVDDLKEAGSSPGREFAIALTKLEEAEMWMRRGLDQVEEVGDEELAPEEDAGPEEEEESD